MITAICIALILSVTSCSKSALNKNAENLKEVGVSSHDLLSADKYTSIKIEIQYMPGFSPDPNAVTNLNSFLSTLSNKPSGISVIQTQIPSAGKSELSLSDIIALEKSNRTVYTTGSQLGVYILYADGLYAENNVLGLAYKNTSICILGKTIHDNSGSIGQSSRTKLESTVIEHEICHILGLVDLGSSMQTNHKDAAHGNHCTNTNCLMYYQSETTDILGFLIAGDAPTLDANCRADLTANGGK